MNKKLAGMALAGLASVGLLTGCSVKQVDMAVTGATLVPGTGNLYRFCDGTTLIYFSNWGGTSNDEYEFIVYGGCKENVPTDDAPSQEGVQTVPDSDD